MRLAHTVIAIDEATEWAIREHTPGVHVVRLPNCVDLSAVLQSIVGNCNGRPPTILYLGWIIPTKGIEELMQAWSSLPPSAWRLELTGPGEQSYCDGLLKRYAPRSLEIFGEMAHVAALERMARADVVVLPSYTEGFPNVVAEAMALGKPVIATTVGAIPEMLADDCGVLVPPRDAVSLRDAMARVLNDAGLRARLGDSARRRALTLYALPVVFQRLVDLWRAAAESSSSEHRDMTVPGSG
jgi:glycosyltransferase involved in cell wall biosynthesis